ncbi:PH domain-containing protein [Pseudonocardia bannensis]|uniref:PH domain-containing protein n=1 Tax=Pseudonocardia bannensis TaxID=630973 RepID=A0A848DG16_9PSEU|nr:PH domain-containing protein [Pseudonocardia bannensis]NMH91499.1 PH domain-containing protein [Pseudonocardia bannensis]
MQPLRWSPPAVLVVLAWLGTAGAVAWFVLLLLSQADPAGRLLSGVAAVGLLVAAVFGTVARPRLAADTSGVTVRGLGAPHHHPWSRVPGVRVLRTRRFGRETPLLELDVVGEDGRERLFVFGRLDLGEDPEEVGDRLLALRAG